MANVDIEAPIDWGKPLAWYRVEDGYTINTAVNPKHDEEKWLAVWVPKEVDPEEFFKTGGVVFDRETGCVGQDGKERDYAWGKRGTKWRLVNIDPQSPEGKEGMVQYTPQPKDTPAMQISGFGRWIKHHGFGQPEFTRGISVAVLLDSGSCFEIDADAADWVHENLTGDVQYFAMPEGHEGYAVVTDDESEWEGMTAPEIVAAIAKRKQAELEENPLYGEWA